MNETEVAAWRVVGLKRAIPLHANHLKGQPQPLTVVELFGRTENGESVCLLVHGLANL